MALLARTLSTRPGIWLGLVHALTSFTETRAAAKVCLTVDEISSTIAVVLAD